jgi:hypothetical protein
VDRDDNDRRWREGDRHGRDKAGRAEEGHRGWDRSGHGDRGHDGDRNRDRDRDRRRSG